jgi:hypothetical protein
MPTVGSAEVRAVCGPLRLFTGPGLSRVNGNAAIDAAMLRTAEEAGLRYLRATRYCAAPFQSTQIKWVLQSVLKSAAFPITRPWPPCVGEITVN